MVKKKKKFRTCHDCEDAIYICEGDFICDLDPTAGLVISDWIPTNIFSKCNGKRYVCLKCQNAEHKPEAKFCKICGLKINGN
jgi:hypothetical protein